MPARVLIDPRDHPVDKVLFDEAECGRWNPQRFEFSQLTSVLHWDRAAKLMVGHRRVRADEFWVRGHIPDRPLFPGVLMIEALAQLASLHCHLQY
ncbi:MAG TPA: beta-hydroxyacyl-ACP dehydratase, partial [Planctomycetota bacterium]